jgi:hypothetical protein
MTACQHVVTVSSEGLNRHKKLLYVDMHEGVFNTVISVPSVFSEGMRHLSAVCFW